MILSFVILLWAAITMVVAIPDGHYLYTSKKPAIEVALMTRSGHAELSVKCGSAKYRTNWFEPSGSEEDSAIFHRFPETSRETHTYGHLLKSLQIACTKIAIESPDLQELGLDKEGDITSQLGGRKITLKRRWRPLIGGNFMSDTPLSPIKQQFDIHPDGHVFVRFHCDGGGDTGYMLYRLSEKRDTRIYELTRARGGQPVQHLLDRFKAVCRSIWSEDNNYGKQLPGSLPPRL
ncbi:hypothetical protein FOL46_009365, partial [Perkinsus olseni]